MSGVAARLAGKEGRRAGGLIPFITAGDPDLDTTAELILALDGAGAAILELGVPFSDPMADGPVIQRASERALKNRVSLADCLALIGRVRKQSSIPIVLFSYLNPLVNFKLERLAEQMAEHGVDGILATDLTPEESGFFAPAFRERGIDVIYLAAPTSTDERLERISKAASGFIYAVSRTGVTGVQENLSEAAQQLVGRIRKHSPLPIAVGFGISHPDQVRAVLRFADAAVVGSALVREIEQRRGQADLVERVTEFFRWLKGDAEE